MAQIEAARIAQEQKAARSGAVFGAGMSPQAQGAVERTGEMNKQINAQLAQLTRRMQEMNKSDTIMIHSCFSYEVLSP